MTWLSLLPIFQVSNRIAKINLGLIEQTMPQTRPDNCTQDYISQQSIQIRRPSVFPSCRNHALKNTRLRRVGQIINHTTEFEEDLTRKLQDSDSSKCKPAYYRFLCKPTVFFVSSILGVLFWAYSINFLCSKPALNVMFRMIILWSHPLIKDIMDWNITSKSLEICSCYIMHLSQLERLRVVTSLYTASWPFEFQLSGNTNSFL